MPSESMFKKCKKCSKQMEKQSKSCPFCGTRQTASYISRFLITAVVLFILIGILNIDTSNKNKTIIQASKSDSNIETQNNLQTNQEQKRFTDVYEHFSTTYDKAKNELQKSILRDNRKSKVSQLGYPSIEVTDWIGTISTISTNNDGDGILAIKISPNVRVGTWNNSISDLTQGTLIPKGSKLYNKLSHFGYGEKIKFSGNFFSSDDDAVYEKSMTIDGSMRQPELLFKFSDVSSIK